MSCVLKIKEVMPSLTNSEIKIAKYILDHKEEVIRSSTQSLAKNIGTSPATLVRFSKSIGYSGFPELKIDLAKDTGQKNIDLTQDLNENDDISTLVKKMLNHRISNLNKLIEILNYDQIYKAITYINKAEKIHLVGVGASGLVCNDLFYKLTRIGKNVIYTSDIHALIPAINSINDKDVLIAISYSGTSKEVLLASEIANNKNSKIVAITQMGKTPLSKLASALCSVPNNENYLRIGAIDSRDASLYLADLLFLGVAMNNLEDANIKLKQSKELVNKL